MRIAIRVLAILSMLLSAVALWLLYGTGGLADTDPRFAISILAVLLGFLIGFATFVISLIAAASRRQIAWLVGLLVTVLVVLAGSFGLDYLLPVLVTQPPSLPACQTALPTAPQCQLSGAQEFLLNLPVLFGMAAPFLIGLVALLYSFRMREARVSVPAL